MNEHKYKINEEVYAVSGFQMAKVKIKKITYVITETGSSFEYTTALWNDKEKKFSEAYLVRDFETARQSCLTNLETAYKEQKKGLEKGMASDFDYFKKEKNAN